MPEAVNSGDSGRKSRETKIKNVLQYSQHRRKEELAILILCYTIGINYKLFF